MGDMEDALYSDTGYNYLGKHYSEYCDVDSMLKVYAVNEITKNWDSYVGSTFFHKDRDKDGKTALIYGGPVWDYDNAFANLNRSGSNNGRIGTSEKIMNLFGQTVRATGINVISDIISPRTASLKISSAT